MVALGGPRLQAGHGVQVAGVLLALEAGHAGALVVLRKDRLRVNFPVRRPLARGCGQDADPLPETVGRISASASRSSRL